MVVYQLSWMDCLFPSPCRIFQFLYLKKWMGVGEAIHCSPLCLMRHGTWKEEKCVPQVGHFFTNFSVGYLDSFFENEIEIMCLDYVKSKLQPVWLKGSKHFGGYVMVKNVGFLSKNKKICKIHLWQQISPFEKSKEILPWIDIGNYSTCSKSFLSYPVTEDKLAKLLSSN